MWQRYGYRHVAAGPGDMADGYRYVAAGLGYVVERWVHTCCTWTWRHGREMGTGMLQLDLDMWQRDGYRYLLQLELRTWVERWVQVFITAGPGDMVERWVHVFIAAGPGDVVERWVQACCNWTWRCDRDMGTNMLQLDLEMWQVGTDMLQLDLEMWQRDGYRHVAAGLGDVVGRYRHVAAGPGYVVEIWVQTWCSWTWRQDREMGTDMLQLDLEKWQRDGYRHVAAGTGNVVERWIQVFIAAGTVRKQVERWVEVVAAGLGEKEDGYRQCIAGLGENVDLTFTIQCKDNSGKFNDSG